MVDSISNSPVAALLRQQSAGTVSTVRGAQDATQSFGTQLQKATAPAKPATVTQPTKIFSPSGNLPRGSLVDKLV